MTHDVAQTVKPLPTQQESAGGTGTDREPRGCFALLLSVTQRSTKASTEKDHKAGSRSKPLSQSVESYYSPPKHHVSSTDPASVHESALAELFVSLSPLTLLRPPVSPSLRK